MKIVIVRHAKVLFNKQKIYPNEMGKWLNQYNIDEISEEIPGDKSFRIVMDKSEIFLCSSMPRSLASLELYGKTSNHIDKVFDEVSLPYPNKRGFFKLSPPLWRIVFRIAWLFGYSQNSESIKDAKLRAKKATTLLIESSKNGNVTLLGHGIMNRLIVKELEREKWKTLKKFNSNNWGYGVFEYDK